MILETKVKSVSTPSFIVSILVHLLLLGTTLSIIIIYSKNYSFFSWHPICMSTGVLFLIVEGVFSIFGEANLVHRFSRAHRITAHWIISTVGLALMFIGFIIVVVNKNRLGKEHFKTIHGKLGLSTIILACVISAFGIIANNKHWVYPRIKETIVEVFHAISGIFMIILVFATVINGVYKMKISSETEQNLISAALVITVVLVLFKPVIVAIASTKAIQPSESNHQSA